MSFVLTGLALELHCGKVRKKKDAGYVTGNWTQKFHVRELV